MAWLLGGLLGGMLYMLVLGSGGLVNLWDYAAENRRLQQENAQLAERNRVLSVELEDLREGEESLEALVRNRLGMIGEGEEFYQLVGPQPQAQPGARAQPLAEESP